MHVCEWCGLREMTDVCSDFCVVCICLVSRPVSYVYYLYLQLNVYYVAHSSVGRSIGHIRKRNRIAHRSSHRIGQGTSPPRHAPRTRLRYSY